MFLAIAVAVMLLLLGALFALRPQDIPEPVPPSPTHHLDLRKAAIYENLRDLNFEYRVGKLSDEDYARTKKSLQGELGTLLAEFDRLSPAKTAAPLKPAASVNGFVSKGGNICPHCSAKFDKPLKFCGECGKSMAVTA